MSQFQLSGSASSPSTRITQNIQKQPHTLGSIHRGPNMLFLGSMHPLLPNSSQSSSGEGPLFGGAPPSSLQVDPCTHNHDLRPNMRRRQFVNTLAALLCLPPQTLPSNTTTFQSLSGLHHLFVSTSTRTNKFRTQPSLTSKPNKFGIARVHHDSTNKFRSLQRAYPCTHNNQSSGSAEAGECGNRLFPDKNKAKSREKVGWQI